MKQAPKGPSSRKPPEPSDSHAEIEDWMRRLVPDLQPLAQHVDGLIRKAHPGVQFGLKWKKAHYGLPDVGWFAELVAYDVSVNVLFYGGADLDPPPPLGDGRSRYVKLKSLEEAKQPELASWIEQAGRVPGWQ